MTKDQNDIMTPAIWTKTWEEARKNNPTESAMIPAIRFIDTEWIKEETTDQAIESLARYFWLFTDISPGIKDIIARYVNENAVNGILRQKNRNHPGCSNLECKYS